MWATLSVSVFPRVPGCVGRGLGAWVRAWVPLTRLRRCGYVRPRSRTCIDLHLPNLRYPPTSSLRSPPFSPPFLLLSPHA
eukprot:549012-Pleurochrysis_carterae.AAC.1